MTDRRRALEGVVLLGLAIFLWGTAFRAHAEALDHASPLVFAALRAVPAAIMLCAVALIARRRLTRAHVGWAALTGVMMVAITLGGVSEAIPLAGAATTAVIFNSYPFLVLVLGVWVLRERVTRGAVAGLCIGFAGLVALVLSQSGTQDGSDVLLGAAVAAIVAAAWGGGTVIVAWLIRAGARVDLLAFTAVQHVAGGLLLLALAAPSIGEADWAAEELWVAGAWTAIGSSAIATLAFFEALRRMTAAAASTWQFLVPTVAVVVEAIAGNAPGPLTLAAMAVTIAGVCIVSTSQPEPVPA